ncbi:hypothetical protein [Celeribacter indicus]|uniref:Uncharacterized protein n=1 Tax=Celeribacter indicus TaxID=1208324 RepID=A0A0B5E619_9RHOB|nr:hypothetical protein [Celeribacter indicus]AJE48850.1 hypothetical protein P73_4135 [Celeribacter indicus]SDW39097.1 hypothetical protein SAMN05443573_10355 [Celeribacter indicus]
MKSTMRNDLSGGFPTIREVEEDIFSRCDVEMDRRGAARDIRQILKANRPVRTLRPRPRAGEGILAAGSAAFRNFIGANTAFFTGGLGRIFGAGN